MRISCRFGILLLLPVAFALLGTTLVANQHWVGDAIAQDSDDHLTSQDIEPDESSTLPVNADPASAINISLRTEKPGASAGDELQLTAVVDRDCHLLVVSVASSGEVTVLWPNKSSSWNDRVSANRPVAIPGSAAEFKMQVDGSVPFERVSAIATTNFRDLFLESDFEQTESGLVRVFSGDIDDLCDLLLVKTSGLSPSVAWGTANLVIPVSPEAEGQQERSLSVKLRPQETQQWCWAASGQMVMGHFRINAPQYYQANKFLRRSDCGKIQRCPKPIEKHPCVKPGNAEFKRFGLRFARSKGALSWNRLKQQLAHNKPIYFSWRWNGGGGHAMVASGYVEKKGKKYVRVLDPWPPCKGDRKIMTYANYVKGADYKHGIDTFNFAKKTRRSRKGLDTHGPEIAEDQ